MDGYCLFVKRDVFEKLGGFDEGYDGWHGYDIDICAKAMSMGYKNYVIHQPSTHYSWGSSGSALTAALSRFKEKWQMMFSQTKQKNKLKIVVYTICKNELQFVERFVKSCEGADGIYVLDTGSTDGTPEALAKLGVTVQVVPFDKWSTLEEYDRLVAEGKNPWRFDVARNMSIDMCPQDADVLVCIDLDEVLVPGWREEIEKHWKNDINHLSYFFAWSMENGKPKNCFWYEKIHDRHSYIWVAPVHEAIVLKAGARDVRAWTRECLVQHYPDPTKSRAQYLPLLELGVRESPHDTRIRFYLGREYTFKGRHLDAINSHKHFLQMHGSNCARERANACLQIASCYGKFKSDALAEKNKVKADEHDREQFNWLLKATMEHPDQREAWVELADYCRLKGDNLLGYWAIKRALAIPTGLCDGNYLVNPDDWTYRPHDLAAILGWYSFNANQQEEAMQSAWEALAYSPFSDHLASNYRICQGLLAKPSTARSVDVDVIILSYSKSAREYEMTKGAIKSLRESSPDVGMRFVVVETNKSLPDADFVKADKGQLFGPQIEVCFPNEDFGFNKYLNFGYKHLMETGTTSKYIAVMNNDVILFNKGFMSHMINGLKSVSSASPLGLREATWGLVNRSVPIDENYDINRSVNGWFLMFNTSILNAIPFEALFPTQFTWYGGDIHYAETLAKCGYKHGLVNAAQALHLQRQSHSLRSDEPHGLDIRKLLVVDGKGKEMVDVTDQFSFSTGKIAPADRVEMLHLLGLKGKRCVEIGVERGHYSKEILAQNPSSLMLIDPWCHQDESVYPNDTSNVSNDEAEKRFQEVQQTLGGDRRVTVCRAFSVRAAALVPDESVDFVYIDAIHTKTAVLEDMYTWWPKVKPGGWLCGHDYHMSGVIDAVGEFLAKNNLKLEFVTKEESCSWAIKK
jgi:GT2 family glycosyltransferase